MDGSHQTPFSARHRGQHRLVDADCPATTRNGLLHLLVDLVEKEYVKNWAVVARELQRLARVSPVDYNLGSVSSMRQARADVADLLDSLAWEKVYDLCERLYSHLACDVGYSWNDDFHVTTSKTDVQRFIAIEIQRLFLEEGLAFEFVDGSVRRRGRKHTVDTSTKAQVVLGDTRLAKARKHYDKALHFFRNPTKPDYENAVKEAVCAVEAAGKALFPSAKAATLGDLSKWLVNDPDLSVPKGIGQTFTGVYAYRSGGDGIGHGGSAGGVATMEVAEFVLAVCASQIIFLVDLWNAQDMDVPF